MADESRIERELSGTEYSYGSRIEEFIAWLNEEIPTHPEPRSRIEEQLAAMTPGGGGGSATLIEKKVIQNGIYNASSDDADGYSKVTVEVPAPTLVSKNITSNDTYDPSDDNADGYSSVTVNVPQPTMVETTSSADLTGYEAGDMELGNGWDFRLNNGTAAVSSETVDGVTYNGLRTTVDAVISTGTVYPRATTTLEIEMIEKSFEYHSYYHTVRILSTAGNFEGSVYVSSDSDYIRLCHYRSTILDTDHIVQIDSGNCYDTSVTKSDMIDHVFNVKYVDDGTYITMYINDVAKLRWTSLVFRSVLTTYGMKIGAFESIGGSTTLVTKAEYNGGEVLSWNGHNYIEIEIE